MGIIVAVVLVIQFFLNLIPLYSGTVVGVSIPTSIYNNNPGLAFVGLGLAALACLTALKDKRLAFFAYPAAALYEIYYFVSACSIIDQTKDVKGFNVFPCVANIVWWVAITALVVVAAFRGRPVASRVSPPPLPAFEKQHDADSPARNNTPNDERKEKRNPFIIEESPSIDRIEKGSLVRAKEGFFVARLGIRVSSSDVGKVEEITSDGVIAFFKDSVTKFRAEIPFNNLVLLTPNPESPNKTE